MNQQSYITNAQQKGFESRMVLQTQQQQSLQLSMLPEEILVRIGTSVAKLCGIRDFVSLSLVSKRMKRLLIDSEATIADVIRIRAKRINQSSFVSSPIKPMKIRTLEQLTFFETVVRHNIFQENRVHFDFADLQVADSDSMALIKVVRTILNRYPAVSVILEAHCGTPAPTEIAWLYSHYRGKVVRRALVSVEEKEIEWLADAPMEEDSQIRGRVGIRAWGKMVMEIVSQSQHPYGELARQGRGWVEIFLRMEQDSPEADRILEFPSRPDFYNQTPTTPREYTPDPRRGGDTWIRVF